MLRFVPLAALLALASAPALATSYTLDPNHTQAQFVWNHYGFSNLTAQFGKVEGTLDFDADDPAKSTVNATVTMASVNTNSKKLDEKIVASDYFDVAKFPTATFKSTRAPESLGIQQTAAVIALQKRTASKPRRAASTEERSACTTVSRYFVRTVGRTTRRTSPTRESDRSV